MWPTIWKNGPRYGIGALLPWSDRQDQHLIAIRGTGKALNLESARPPAGVLSVTKAIKECSHTFMACALIKARETRNKAKPGIMIGLLQRVTEAAVSVDGEMIAQIDKGLLVFIAVHRDDGPGSVPRMAERILTYRVFPGAEGRMNRSVSEVSGGLLLVPQFTLTADTKKGTRASFTKGAAPGIASAYFDALLQQCSAHLGNVQSGRFGADMQVSLVNDGPVTFWLEA